MKYTKGPRRPKCFFQIEFLNNSFLFSFLGVAINRTAAAVRWLSGELAHLIEIEIRRIDGGGGE